MKGDTAIQTFVDAELELKRLLRLDGFDIAGYERTLRQARNARDDAYTNLTGGQLGKARRILAEHEQQRNTT